MLIGQPKKTASGKIFFLTSTCVLALGVVASVLVFNTVNKDKREVLVQRAESVSVSIDPSIFQNLTGSEKDINLPEYKKLKSIFKSVATVNSDVRFVYAFGKRADGTIYFYADSEDPSSHDFSPPGQEYPEASDVLISLFENGKASIEGPVTDRWGNWISALSPLKVSEATSSASANVSNLSSKMVVIGMDIDAKNYIADIVAYSVAPIGMSFTVILFLYVNFRVRRKNDEITATKLSFVELASHELRSPLSGIRWALESLLSPVNSTQGEVNTISSLQNEKRLLADVYDRSNIMMTTLNNVADVVALESGTAESLDLVSLDLRDVLEESISKVQQEAIKKSIRIDASLPPVGSVIIEADKEHLSRAYSELIRNAIYFSKTGDTVYVRCDAHNNFVIVDIIDNGLGIHPEEVMAAGKKFTLFHRSNSYRVGGVGLGIHLAQKIFEMHKGKILFSAGKSQGTVVHTRLPVVGRVSL